MKTKNIPYLLVLTAVFISSCTGQWEKRAKYEVTVTGNWNSSDFPNDFPPNAHFSKFIGMTHNSGVSLFELGETASEGIKVMAETGKTIPLDKEIEAFVKDNNAFKLIEAENLSSGTASFKFDMVVKKKYPYVSLVSMIAPSPDWFVAVRNIDLHPGKEFIRELSINAETYDAGTDSGLAFTSADSATNPKENIYHITSLPSGEILNKPLVTINFKKTDK